MNNDTISAHQTGVIAGLLLFTLKMSSLPSLLYKYNRSGAIFTLLIVVALNALFLWLIVWLKKKYPKYDLYNLFKKKLGVVLTKTMYLVFFALFFLKILLMISDGFTFIRDVADSEYTIFNLFICFMPIIGALAFSGIRNLGRTCEFFLPFVVVSLAFAIIFSYIPVSSWSFGSLGNASFQGFLNSFFRLSFWTGDLFAILIFLDKVDLKKGKISHIFVPFTIMAILLIIIYFLYYTLYQETSIFHVNVLNDVVQYAIGTSQGWHMDIFAIVVFFINMYLQGAILLFCANECIKKVLNYKINAVSLSTIVFALVASEFLFLTDYKKYIYFAENILCYFSAILIALVPLVLIIFALTQKENSNETT